jgi:hypothetical protein
MSLTVVKGLKRMDLLRTRRPQNQARGVAGMLELISQSV